VVGNPPRAVLDDLVAGPNLDNARRVGLDPDRGLLRIHMAEKWPEKQCGHADTCTTVQGPARAGRRLSLRKITDQCGQGVRAGGAPCPLTRLSLPWPTVTQLSDTLMSSGLRPRSGRPLVGARTPSDRCRVRRTARA
jgi:hypothetical protein